VSIGSELTGTEHVKKLWTIIQQAAASAA